MMATSPIAMMATSMPGTPIELPLAGRSPMPKTGIASPKSSTKEKSAKQLRDNAVTMQLTKTKMCAFFERGKCASVNCRYAHSQSELRLPPNLQKTKLCRAFLADGCTDENCFFAHGETDLRVTEGIYKTQICNFFERGYCKKADRCNHAHGLSDLRPPSAVATTPMGKTSPSSAGALSGKSSQSRRSPLPLSELLVVDSEANAGYQPSFGMMPPTPQKSVTELAQMAFSPVHSTPLWTQYGMHALSPMPMGPLGHPVNDLASMWPPPRDAVDMLVQPMEPRMSLSPTANVFYPPSMDFMEPVVNSMPLPENTPERTLLNLDPSPLHRPAPGLVEPRGTPPPRGLVTPMAMAMAEPLTAPAVMAGAPGLGEPAMVASPAPGLEQPTRDPLMINLSERLASLDAVVLGLGSDIAAIKSDPKKLHRI